MSKHKFTNPHIQNLRRSFWHVILWQTGFYDDLKPTLVPPSDFIYPASSKPFQKNQPSAVWIGHSTFLIEVEGLTVLTDPVWSAYCSPLPIKTLRRYREPPIALSHLPSIDLVLISHNHYDHLDSKTVSRLNDLYPHILWVVPERLSYWFHKRKIKNVVELPRWTSYSYKNSTITAVPAQHCSGRTLWDQNRTHWNGYVIETPLKKIYFAGDTGYNSKDFKAIGHRFGSLDLSLIPIGTYVPKDFMKTVHIGPFEAVQIHQEVHSRLSLGMHWNTFHLSDEPINRPPYDLFLAMEEKKLPLDTFLPIDIGIQINF